MHSGSLLGIIRSAARRSIPPLCIAVAVSAGVAVGVSICAYITYTELTKGLGKTKQKLSETDEELSKQEAQAGYEIWAVSKSFAVPELPLTAAPGAQQVLEGSVASHAAQAAGCESQQALTPLTVVATEGQFMTPRGPLQSHPLVDDSDSESM